MELSKNKRMIPNITVMRWYFLVQISKELMKQKRTLPGGIIVPDTDESGEHSLCYGTIVQIGKDANGNEYANKNFPEAQVGDTIILHHWVETGHNYGNPDDEFIYVAVRDDGHDIKAVQKADGTIIPHPEEVWCLPLEKEVVTNEYVPFGASNVTIPSQWKVGQGGLYLFDGDLEDEKMLRERVDEIETHNKFMADTQLNEATVARLAANKKEAEQATTKLNTQVVHELSLFAINTETRKRLSNIDPQDRVFVLGWMENAGYELDYKGTRYTLVKSSAVLYAVRKSLLQ